GIRDFHVTGVQTCALPIYSSEVVDIIFNRDIIINEAEVINMARNSVGILSDETIVANHPWTTNVQAELERIEAQRQRDMSAFESYQGFIGRDNQEGEAE